MSGAGKAWNDRRFFYWIYRVSDAAARARWLHSLIHKALINKSVSGFFWYSDLLSRYRHLKLEGKLKNQESGIPAEFRRNFAGIFQRPFFLNSKWLRWFSEECTSSEYTPKINRRLSDGFQSYPESPEFLKACFFNSFFFFYQDFSEECTSYEYIHQGLTENYPRVSEVTRRLPRNNRAPGFIYFSLIFLFYLLFIFNY